MKWHIIMDFIVETNQATTEELAEIREVLKKLDMAYEVKSEILGNFSEKDVGNIEVSQISLAVGVAKQDAA